MQMLGANRLLQDHRHYYLDKPSSHQSSSVYGEPKRTQPGEHVKKRKWSHTPRKVKKKTNRSVGISVRIALVLVYTPPLPGCREKSEYFVACSPGPTYNLVARRRPDCSIMRRNYVRRVLCLPSRVAHSLVWILPDCHGIVASWSCLAAAVV